MFFKRSLEQCSSTFFVMVHPKDVLIIHVPYLLTRPSPNCTNVCKYPGLNKQVPYSVTQLHNSIKNGPLSVAYESQINN